MSTPPALGLLELDSIAHGILVGDAMIKKAPLTHLYTGTIHPGHYLLLAIGDVAPVEEALAAGQIAAAQTGTPHPCRDQLFLPFAHPAIVNALQNNTPTTTLGEAFTIIETHTVAAAIRATDAACKGADIILWQLRLGDGLGGKGLALFNGRIADVEAARDLATTAAGDHLFRHTIIPQLHPEMLPNLIPPAHFGTHYNWQAT
ncbi:MAG TPA: BMC domain-containing protein [Anaerolineae bacterium]|nr:BMC domain-containing protein [Anaerolineae bacterium]